MKNKTFSKSSFIITVAAALFVANALAQDAAPASAVAQTTTIIAPAAPSLPSGVSQVLQLQQAKISDSTITAFIQNSPTVYTLDADQIIYLKQQGVTDAVINTMLNHKGMAATTASASTSTATVAPTVTTYTQPTAYVPATTVYYVPNTPAYNYYYPDYYPYDVWHYPDVSLSFGFGGGYRGGWNGGGWRGGGGWHHR